jgi:ligand-binding sensor domain-containing protein
MQRSPKLAMHLRKLRGVALLAALILCLSTASLALDRDRRIDQYGHDFWTSQNGLPGESVYQILQGRDGYLWLRTSAGLVRFDGVRFVLIAPVVGGRAVHEPIKAMCVGADGYLLVRTLSRTLIYKDAIFVDYLPPAPLPDGDIRVLFESSRHEVFIGSDNFICRIGKDGPQQLLRDTSLIYAFLEDEQGTVWIAGVYGVYRYRDGVVRPFGADPKNPPLSHALAEDKAKRVLIATGEGLRQIDRGAVVPVPAAQQDHAEVNALLVDRQGNFWVATNRAGLHRITGNQVLSFQSPDGLTSDRVLALYEDHEGSLWVGTARGLDRFRDTTLTTLSSSEGLPSNEAERIIAARDGSVYVFCAGGGLARIRDGVVSAVRARSGPADLWGQGLFESGAGGVWFANGAVLTRFLDGKFTRYPLPRLLGRFTSAINEDDESLILATNEAVALRLRNGDAVPLTFRGRTTPLSTPGAYTFTIYRDPSGTLWFGTSSGLFQFARGEPPEKAWRKQIGFPVTTIFDDGMGSLWLGGRVPGLTRFRIADGRVTRYTASDGLFDDSPSTILADDAGNLWIDTASGIYRVPRRDLDDFADGRTSVVATTRYGTPDGARSTETSSGQAQPAGCRTRDGRLWFCTQMGVVIVDPKHLARNSLVPPVVIEEIVADGRTLPAHADLHVAAGNGQD